MITNTEFYLTPKGDVMVHTDKGTKKLEFTMRDFVHKLYLMFWDLYPEAMQACDKEYHKFKTLPAVFEFMCARRMIKCNFGSFDNVMDIDHLGNFNFEDVHCVLRGECQLEGIVCRPKLNTTLTEREMQIMELLFEGVPQEDVASACALSIETVRSHKRNSLKKLGLHSMAEFNTYARQKNLFNK